MLADTELALIPRVVRDKLDRVGIKLHLKQWSLMSMAERRHLADLRCDSPAESALYRNEVERLVVQHTGESAEQIPQR